MYACIYIVKLVAYHNKDTVVDNNPQNLSCPCVQPKDTDMKIASFLQTITETVIYITEPDKIESGFFSISVLAMHSCFLVPVLCVGCRVFSPQGISDS